MIAGLTPNEVSVLQLGWIVRQEKTRERMDSSHRRKYSKPRKSTREALHDYSEKL